MSRPDANFIATSIPSATCRRMRSRCMASPRSSSPASRCSRRSSTSCSPSSARTRWSFTTPNSILAFLNAELARLQRDPIGCCFVDTLGLARVRFPGAPASLDALCRRFDIDLSLRVEHGAEIDCGLLAAVYLELLGGRQPGLDFVAPRRAGDRRSSGSCGRRGRMQPSAEELIAHQAMLQMHYRTRSG